MRRNQPALLLLVFLPFLLGACSTVDRRENRASAKGEPILRGIASAGDPEFRLAMEDLQNLPNAMVPPQPYEFWDGRMQKLLVKSAEALELVSRSNLSRDECIAIMAYSDTIYSVINRALWSRDDRLLRRLEPIIATLNRGLSKLPKYTGQAFRIVGFGASVNREGVLRQNRPGSVSKYLGYTSTSKDISWLSRPENQRPDALFLEIASKNGRWIGPLTASALNGDSQDEVLFLPDSQFKAMRIESGSSGTATIHLVEVE